MKTAIVLSHLFILTQSVQPLLAQWSRTDQFYLSPGLDTRGTGIATNAAGALIVVGRGAYNAAGNFCGLVRQSTDLGASWTSNSPYNAPGANNTAFAAVANSSQGLFAGGYYTLAGGLSVGFVVQSLDGGSNWSGPAADAQFQIAPGKNSACSTLTADNTGAVYAGGFAVAADGQQYWIIRRRDPVAAAWAIVDQVAGGNAIAMAADPVGGVFAVGYTGNKMSALSWVVRHSIDGNANWTMLDQNTGGAHGISLAEGVAIDGANRTLYVVGHVGTAWVVRRGVNWGTSWKTIDNFQFAKSGTSSACAAALDYLGNLHVLGSGTDNNGVWHWLVRTLPAAGAPWKTSDDFQLVTGQSASPACCAAVNGGALVLATGAAKDSLSVYEGVTRMLAP